MGKGENAGIPAFSPFPIMFSTLPRKKFDILVSTILLSAIALNLDTFEIMLLDNKCFCQHKLFLNHWISTLDLTKLKVFADGFQSTRT